MKTAEAIAAEVLEGLYEESGPWGDPDPSLIAPEPIPPTSLPEGIFPPRWAEWIAQAAEGAGAPVDFVAAALLSVAGILIGNARWARPWHGWEEPPIINAALVGRPSSGKSPAMDRLTKLLGVLETEANADLADRRREFQRAEAEYRERLRAWEADVKEAVKTGDPAPLRPVDLEPPTPARRARLYSTDPTTEKAARLLAENPRGLILPADELAGWLARMDRYSATSGGDRAFWLTAYGGRAWTPDRVKDGENEVFVPHLLWAVIGGIQPDRLNSALLSGDDDGLAARFLYVWPHPVTPHRPRFIADDEAALDRLRRLRELPWAPPEPVVVPFSAKAAAALDEWRCEVARLEALAGGLFLSWLGKLPVFAVRLALILEFLAWSEAPPGTAEPAVVSERAAIAAIAFLADYAVDMARRAMGAAALPEAERDARLLARWLIAQRPIPERINARELRRLPDGPNIPTAERMDAALAELAKDGWVRPALAKEGGAGRRRKDWEINPKIREIREAMK